MLAAVSILKVVAIFSLLTDDVLALECFFCKSDVQDKCFYGDKTLTVKNCSGPGVCIAYKIDVVSNDGQYTSTWRGCQTFPNATKACSILMTEKKARGGIIHRGKSCRICNENRCNSLSSQTQSSIAIIFAAFLTSQIVTFIQ